MGRDGSPPLSTGETHQDTGARLGSPAQADIDTIQQVCVMEAAEMLRTEVQEVGGEAESGIFLDQGEKETLLPSVSA